MYLCSPTHSTDIVMKECAAYGGVITHSQMEDVYENPQWIDNNTSLLKKLFVDPDSLFKV